MPERFGLTYTGADNAEHQPVMIHRALMGSYERFIGILIEHFGGELPVWLTPGAGDRAADLRPSRRLCAAPCRGSCTRGGVRAELDERTESVARKIRDAELRKIPYMLVVGDREQETRRGRRSRAPARRRGLRVHGSGSSQSAAAGSAFERVARRDRLPPLYSALLIHARHHTRPGTA